MKSRHYLSLAVLAVVALTGCGGGGGGGPTDIPGTTDRVAPTISGATLDQSSLRFSGGPVVVSANVTDAGGVNRVTAAIRKPDNTTQSVTLANAGGSTFHGTWTAPPNVGSDQPATYTVTIGATDASGNATTAAPLTLMVSPAELPPPPPPPAP